MNRRWDDSLPKDDDGAFPPCAFEAGGECCDEPVAVDAAGFRYAFCPHHLLTASEVRSA